MANAYSNLTNAVSFDFWAQPVLTDASGALYCPGYTGKTFMKGAWDSVKIGSLQTPGTCDVTVSKSRDVDKKKAAGSDGARITIHGIDPGSGEITLTIWTPEQLKTLRSVWEQIFPSSNKRPKGVAASSPWPPAFDVAHPIFRTHSIKSVVFTGGEGPKTGSVRGTRIFTIRWQEYLAPSKKKVTHSPVASKGSTLDPAQKGNYPTPGSNKKNTGPVAQ